VHERVTLEFYERAWVVSFIHKRQIEDLFVPAGEALHPLPCAICRTHLPIGVSPLILAAQHYVCRLLCRHVFSHGVTESWKVDAREQ